MKRNIGNYIIRLVFAGALLIGLLTVTGCSDRCVHSNQSVLIHDTLRILQRDSIVRTDSVIVDRWQRGDTLIVTKLVSRYRDRVKVDTLIQVRTDTVTIRTEVNHSEPTPGKWTGFLQILAIMAVSIAALFIYSKLTT